MAQILPVGVIGTLVRVPQGRERRVRFLCVLGLQQEIGPVDPAGGTQGEDPPGRIEQSKGAVEIALPLGAEH